MRGEDDVVGAVRAVPEGERASDVAQGVQVHVHAVHRATPVPAGACTYMLPVSEVNEVPLFGSGQVGMEECTELITRMRNVLVARRARRAALERRVDVCPRASLTGLSQLR